MFWGSLQRSFTTRMAGRPISGPPSGRRDAQGMALSGHTDVVPVEGQNWSSDPFKLTARGGNLLGRGSADMKGFIAACLHLAQQCGEAKTSHAAAFCFFL